MHLHFKKNIQFLMLLSATISCFSCEKKGYNVVLPTAVIGPIRESGKYIRNTFHGESTRKIRKLKLIFSRYIANRESYFLSSETMEKYPLETTTITFYNEPIVFDYFDDNILVPVYYVEGDDSIVVVGTDEYFEKYLFEESQITLF